jgi:hypothetical protein
MSSIVISGDTSGSVTLQAPAIAGSTVVTLPTTSMNIGTGGGSVATNTAFGAGALNANTSGSNNVAVGQNCMALNTTGANNTAIGRDASYGNTTGTNNTALGYRALDGNTASYNTGIGTDALRSNTTASNSTAVGYQAGYTSTGQRNAFFGSEAGYSNTTGESNTYIGRQAGYSMTTGVNNTIVGRYSGNQGGLDIRTSSNNIVLSDGDGNPRLKMDSTGQLSSLIVGVGLFEDYGCRAWVNFNGTGTVAIRGSGNVSSVTDLGVGNYRVNFTTAMPDVNYAATTGLTPYNLGTDYRYPTHITATATGSVTLQCNQVINGVAAEDSTLVMLAVFR